MHMQPFVVRMTKFSYYEFIMMMNVLEENLCLAPFVFFTKHLVINNNNPNLNICLKASLKADPCVLMVGQLTLLK